MHERFETLTKEMSFRGSLILAVVTNMAWGLCCNSPQIYLSCIEEGLDDLITSLRWKSVAVIHHEKQTVSLLSTVKQIFYTTGNTNVSVILDEVHETMFPDVNLVLLLEIERMLTVVKHINDFDTKSKWSTDFRHHGKLVIFARSTAVVPRLEAAVSNLDNVLISQIKCKWEMHIMHIHPHGREFSKIRDFKTLATAALFPNTQYGYNNRRLVVSARKSLFFLRKQEINGTVTREGYVWDIWTTIAQVLNFSYVVTEPADGHWGLQDANGAWNGYMQQLINKEVDVVVSDMTVTYERAKYIDFISPSIKVDTQDIIYRKIPAYEKAFYRVSLPFSLNVYFAVLAVFASTVTMYFVFENGLNIAKTGTGEISSFKERMADDLTSFYGSAVRQGFQPGFAPCTKAGKIVTVSWCLFILIETSVYSGNLVASFSADTDTNDISSIDQLVDSDYTVGTFPKGIVARKLKESNQTDIERLNRKMELQSKTNDWIFNNDEEGQLTQVKQKQHAYIAYRSTVQSLVAEDGMLDTVGYSLILAEEHLAFGVPKNSPLKQDIENM